MAKMNPFEIDAFYFEIGQRIQQARKNGSRTLITQKELGDIVGLTRTSITNVEKGRQKLSIHMLYEIADALMVNVNDLLPNSLSRDREDIMAKIPTDLPDETRRLIAAELDNK